MSGQSQHEAQQADARLRKYSRPYSAQYPRKPHIKLVDGVWRVQPFKEGKAAHYSAWRFCQERNYLENRSYARPEPTTLRSAVHPTAQDGSDEHHSIRRGY